MSQSPFNITSQPPQMPRSQVTNKRIAEDMNVPFLGSIPMDPKIAESCDSGRAFFGQDSASPMVRVMNKIIMRIAGDMTRDMTTGEEAGGK